MIVAANDWLKLVLTLLDFSPCEAKRLSSHGAVRLVALAHAERSAPMSRWCRAERTFLESVLSAGDPVELVHANLPACARVLP
jgi:hypothetical protein